MKKSIHNILFLCLILALSTGCTCGGRDNDSTIVAQVNDYKMRIEDLRYELRSIPYDDANLLKTEEGRREYVDRLIEKEILLQEAQRKGLDREKDFMKAIENYWEQALLKLLLEKKSNEISGLIHVYENEIEEYYRDSGETRPLSRARPDITRIIRERKETEAMNAWIEELKKRTYIEVNDKLIKELFSSR